jgi:hypothetical protein
MTVGVDMTVGVERKRAWAALPVGGNRPSSRGLRPECFTGRR